MDRARGAGLVSALLVVATIAGCAYLAGIPGDFVYDDHRLIGKNEGLRRPFDARRAFLRDYYASDVDRMGLGYYRPVAILANEADFRRGDGEPLAFHVTNLLLHAACSVLVVLLARRLLGGSVLAALASGLVFALHPAHAESVAFISGRVDPLATLFALAAILAHLAANRSRRPVPWRFVQGLAWLLALLSKEMAVTAPLLALLLETAEEGRPPRGRIARRATRYLPYAAALAPYLAMRFVALGTLVGEPTGATASLARPLVVLGSYLAWLVLPPPGLHLEPAPVSGSLAVLAACLALGIAAAAMALWRRRERVAAALIGWCVLTLAPVVQLRPIETDLSERFLYLPSVGASVLLGLLLARTRRRVVAAGALAVLVAVYGTFLLQRNAIWRDELRLWRAKLEEDPGSVKANLNLGRALASRRDPSGARAAYERALALSPELEAAIRAEMASLAAGESDADPLGALRRALEATPDDGSLWSNLGFLLLEREDARGAAEAFERAVSLVPLRSTAWLGMALASVELGERDGAARAAERALALNPGLGLARLVLAECALREGRACEALLMAREAKLGDAEEERRRAGILAMAAARCPAQ